MKRIGKKVIPLFVALLILVGVPLTSYEEVKATGVEEYLYYTYWDLMNSLYAMTGYDMKISENEIKNHGVSGKQAWKNFTSFVDNTAKIHWKLYSDAGSSALKELKNLVNTVTQKGISISQNLYDMLKDVFGYQVSGEQFANMTQGDLLCFLNATSDYRFLSSVSTALDNFNYYLGQGYKLNVVKDLNGYFLFVSDPACSLKYVQDTSYPYSVFKCYATKDNRTRELDASRIYSNTKDKSIGVAQTVRATEPVWVIKEGLYVVNDTISAQVSAGACPQEVPDVSPWIKHTDVPDEWRIVKPDEIPDPDDNNDGDALPVVIPIHPAKPDKPSETETEESTEKPDKDKSKDPSVIINPSTGNQIDPNTGLDIDPDTGYLIDPDTGDLIDPNTGKKVDKNKIKNRVKNLPSIASGAGNITKYFPFCIPWDIVALIKTMNAQKSPPVFHFEHYFKVIDYNFVVDVNLEDYWKYIKIFRWGLTIFFIIGLFFLTDKLTTFVHKMVG